jgi:hypothetical protein
MAMEEVGAEAIVFLDYSKDFSMRGEAVLAACRDSAGGSAGDARGSARGLLYILPGAGTLRKNASAN